MTTKLSNLAIDEISILSNGVRPAVRRARIAIAKSEGPPTRAPGQIVEGGRLDAATDVFAGLDLSDLSNLKPEALVKLEAAGLNTSKLSQKMRGRVVASYEAGNRVSLYLEKSRKLYLLQKDDEQAWSLDLPDQAEVEKSKPDPHECLRPENRTAQDERDIDRQQEEDEMNFMDEVEKLAAQGVPRTKAMEQVRRRHPAAYEALQSGKPVAKNAPAKFTKSQAQIQFEDTVASIAKARGIKWTQAADIARRTHADLFAQAYDR